MNTTKGHRGVKCGNCSTRARAVYHKHATAVRECYDATYEGHAQQQAELAAEQAAERYFEEGTPAQQAARQAEADEEARRLGGWL